ncbi:hypothetical protein GCM10011519_11060 [Marmoricola endophyticus]|uniref:DUF3515 domain-containing protein n=1 Tax=Marmoricola endophyticus TaxID=2040280 RepID=A0A917F2S4_9ACTN|nr:DUF3515 domain-containing protein [Marmoricola endophyticus]GGF39209.1 hypothetical protein GCM10011519_11060 [Marmoricola endophyticus]
MSPAAAVLAAVVAAAVVLAVVLVLRGSDVRIDGPSLSPAARKACASLTAALPERVADRDRVEVDTPSRGAAWGDPATVLTCGVSTPADYDPFGMCQETAGIGWYVPRDQIEDQSADVVMTTIGRSPRLQVTVPASQRPPVDVMTDLAPAVRAHTREVGRCR